MELMRFASAFVDLARRLDRYTDGLSGPRPADMSASGNSATHGSDLQPGRFTAIGLQTLGSFGAELECAKCFRPTTLSKPLEKFDLR